MLCVTVITSGPVSLNLTLNIKPEVTEKFLLSSLCKQYLGFCNSCCIYKIQSNAKHRIETSQTWASHMTMKLIDFLDWPMPYNNEESS